jgi:site-specific recombinase XerD
MIEMKNYNAQNESGNASVDQAIEQERFAGFVAELRSRGRAPKTIGSYRSDWIGFNDWYNEHQGSPFSVVTVMPDELRAYIVHLQAQGMRPATVNRKLVFVKRYVSWATALGLVARDICESVRKVKPVPQAPRRPKGLSDLDLKRFLREVERRASPRDQAIVYTLLGTGLRVSELSEMDMSQVINNGNRCTVLVHDFRPHGTRVRRLNITGLAKRKLRQYLIYRGRSTGLVFLGERGPLTANAIQRIVRKYCGFAKVKVSPSTLRHTFASSYLASEGDVVALADLLGHESLETTRLYLSSEMDKARYVGNDEGSIVRPMVIAGGMLSDSE